MVSSAIVDVPPHVSDVDWSDIRATAEAKGM